ncbi:hypothetical protein GCM10023187_46630 [Nibrella viscosa]|uniref:Uncharacterized protein n=1 Tax=Nibrella viscosa TaxID=1084524 RepID=A0ABP8KU25_9BACT
MPFGTLTGTYDEANAPASAIGVSPVDVMYNESPQKGKTIKYDN